MSDDAHYLVRVDLKRLHANLATTWRTRVTAQQARDYLTSSGLAYVGKRKGDFFGPEPVRRPGMETGIVVFHPGCGVKLDGTNFTIDHIKPFAKGGKTSSKNAALICKRHNSMK